MFYEFSAFGHFMAWNMMMEKTAISILLNKTKKHCHSLPILETIMSTDIQAYRNATPMFSHLLIPGFRKTERKIIVSNNLKVAAAFHLIKGRGAGGKYLIGVPIAFQNTWEVNRPGVQVDQSL